MEAVSTPRISGQLLNEFVNQNVMIVGKVQQLRGETAIIDAEGSITANLNRDAHLVSGNGVQIIGKVLPDLSIKVMSSVDLGNNVDFTVAQAVVEATHNHKDLFVFDAGHSGGMVMN